MITSTLTLERRADGVFSDLEQQALLGFLGGYSGLTRDAYALDLRQFATWCQQRQLALFQVARHDIEGFARQLEERGRARATISRRFVHDHLVVPLRRRGGSVGPLPGGACAATAT